MEIGKQDRQAICWKVLPALEYICKHDLSAQKSLGKYFSKQIWSPQDRQEILESLGQLFLQSRGRQLCDCLRPLLLEIISRGCARIEGQESLSFRQHQDFCVALSWCLWRPDVLRFTLEYVKGKPSFLQQDDSSEPKKKKAKKNKVPEETLCQAAWMFTRHLRDAVTTAIQLEDLLPYLSHEKQEVRWYACQAVMELQKMTSLHREQFLQKHFDEAQIRALKISHSITTTESPCIDDLCMADQTSDVSHTKQTLLETDLCDRVTCVAGVLLQKVGPTEKQTLDLLPVPSNLSNLRALATAVAMGAPVLLQGVVGAGKTTLVEHLARLTGRSGPPHLMKIQLGDQMDSKALLGTYRCTEVPGEFVWQPGVLTQAVTRGYWVLLEDLDQAPMEVVTLLLPLLETGALAIPGHGDTVRAAPGFHLFATQRLVSSKSGWQRQHTSTSGLLDKLLTTVLVEPLSRDELAQVLVTKHPALVTVMEKLLDIYFLLSAGDHQGALTDVAMETGDAEMVGKFLSHDGRLISTRDLMTWCSRIAQDFDITSTATSNLVFQEAVDCFVACLSKPAKRMPLWEAIGAKLNVTKVKAEYFTLKYKPEVKVSPSSFSVGRATLPIKERQVTLQTRSRSLFSYTRQSCQLLERVAVAVHSQEPVLLVGETGTGKTSSVQYLAEQLGHKLHVINMNQQSDSADLLGGFKPVDVRHIVRPFFEDFEILFCSSFSRKQNAKFIGHLQDTMGKRKWDTLFSLMEHTTNTAMKKPEQEGSGKKWKKIQRRLSQLKIQVQQTQNALAFTFMEGTLVKALRAGDWVLLDEINLAAMETLECLSGLLESTTGSVLLMERGDIEPVVRHPDFRLFACMNPATDVGKKDLSPGIRNRFTELFVDELEDPQDLKVLVSDYLRGLSLTAGQVDGIVKFYALVRNECSKKLTDGTGHKPHYSLRTLCRALRYAAQNRCGSVARSLYEGFCLSFLTQLDRSSHPVVEQLVCQHVIGKAHVKSVLKQALPAPPGGGSLVFEGYWVSTGELEPEVPDSYILTPSVRANLKDLARVVSAGQHPVLIQGETSVGKTSLIKWLAQSSGNVCVRVNNHEHTDLQEYVGCYAADSSGKLVFKEGVLVEAMRKGQWIILDELNLAPTDVLEALNRLLDDNRELYIPETQETIKAHPKFMLFATQNPPGHYGGRKMLSRAFRNRFVELHFDEIPSSELQTILHERCHIPLSYAKRLVAVMLELQTRRRGSGVFAGKTGFMTLRDLFRWADRYTCPEMDGKRFYNWDKHLADQGYMLLAGRVRKPEESGVIQEVIEKHFKCKIAPTTLYTLDKDTSATSRSVLETVLGKGPSVEGSGLEGFGHVVWTQSMRRMAVLIGQAVRYKEPVLLVGETGCGKTTMCQLYAALYKTQLHAVNCHLHTESADFLGGLRPVREHSQEDKKDRLFEWVDGPLVSAMKNGAMFLIDEISLADDSVLERLNSVLEPERTILLAEKGGGEGPGEDGEAELVAAGQGFHVFATMNPGGDFGKKELSPALRNRFTEIWCPPSNQRRDLIDIIEHNLNAGIHLCNQEDGTSGIGRAIMDFVDWFSNNELGKRCTVSIRDILTWVRFINSCAKTIPDDVAMETDQTTYNQLDPAVAYIHGACLVFLDGLGAGTTSQGHDEVVTQLRTLALTYLLKQVNKLTHQDYTMADLYLLDGRRDTGRVVTETEDAFCIPPFSIPKGDLDARTALNYALDAPGPCVNAQRVLRALQLPRPLLLEGSPGVGKTSLVSALARSAGRQLVRINLSEQTDVSDLFGADLPVEGAEGGVFAWRDGPLLQALKSGSWVVLDELNLASQSVLEGLNACLDHRAEVYVPELGRTFRVQHEKTRLFACQNPLNQGGGRKGLPRSFLNRFTQVYVEPLCEADLMFIATSMFPDIPTQTLSYMVKFNMQMHDETVLWGAWGQRGRPWEFNLRDVFRWCQLLLNNQAVENLNPGEYVGLVYADRMRTQADKQQVYNLYENIFPATMPAYHHTGVFHRDPSTLQVGHSFLKVSSGGEGRRHGNGQGQVAMEILHQSLRPLESVLKCVEMNWMAILVGATCAGKSSVVEMLSQLTGNRLNVLAMNSAMDTTELLGGFEQADVSRHIEEFAAAAETHIQNLCQHCLLDGSTIAMETVAKLQATWKGYTQCQTKGDKTTTVEELEILRSQVAALLSAVTVTRKVARQTKEQTERVGDISRLRKSVTTLKERLSKAVPGQGGGAFEWTDSILVKSLQRGDWLMIDNVNFCSASVLDRLNALLEPDGVLSINERGVIDGKIPTIKPHPNFRLFLTMDPRHGEISRAMRNRGVEIYLPGEEDGGSLSDLDLRLMLASKGLPSKTAFDWLRRLHDNLREELPLGDKPNLQALLQVCQHVVAHRNHGNGVKAALEAACRCVYVQRQRHSDSKKVALTVLQTHLEDWAEDTSGTRKEPELGLSPVTLPSVQQYVLDPQGSQVTRNVALLVHLLETSDGDDSKARLAQKFALCHLLGQTADCALQFTVDWLQNFVTNNTRAQSQEVCKYGLDSLQEVYTQIQSALETMKYRDLIGQSGVESTDLPLDLQWNTQGLQKLVQTADTDTRSTLMTSLITASNRLHALQYFLVEICLLRKCLSQLQDAVHRDGERGSRSVHESVVHLVAMFSALLSGVTRLIPDLEMTDYNMAAKIVESVGWTRRLFEVAMETLGTGLAASRLPLYWKWFQTKALITIYNGQQGRFCDMKLATIVSTLQGMLGKDDRKWKQFVKALRSWGHPRPFQSDLEARYHGDVAKVAGILRLHGNSTELLDKARVSLVVGHREFLIKAMSCLMRTGELTEDETDDLEKTLTLLLAKLTQHGLYSQYDQSGLSEMETDDDIPPTATETETGKGDHSYQTSSISFVQLWPLFEYSSVTEGWRLLDRMVSGELAEGELETFVDHANQFTPMSPVDVIKLQRLNKDNLKEELSAMVVSILTRLRRSTVTDQLSKWLNWSGEQLTDGQAKQQGCLHHMALSSILYQLLSGASPSPSKTPVVASTSTNMQLSTPLKHHSREITQLTCISRQLWSHVAAYNHPDRTTSMLDVQAYFSMLKHTLASVKPLLPVECIPEFNTMLTDTVIGQSMSADIVQTVSQFLSARLSTQDSETVTLVQSCLTATCDLLGDKFGDFEKLGSAWVQLGLLGMVLLAPKGPVDPVEKVHIKLKILKEELTSVETELEVLCQHHRLVTGQDITQLTSVETELEVLCQHHRLVTGQDITQVPPRLVHPRVGHLLDRSGEITLQIEALSQQLAYRPPVSQYAQLVQDIANYLGSIGSVETVAKLTSKLQKQIRRTSSTGNGLLQEVELWVKSQESFVAMVMSEYQQYRDVTTPFVCTVNQLLHGVHVLFHTLRQSLQTLSLSKSLPERPRPSREVLLTSLERLMLGVGRFPTVSTDHPSCVHLAAALSADPSLALMKAVVVRGSNQEQEVSTDPTVMLTDSILSSSLMHLLNEARVIGKLSPDIVSTLTHILELYVLSWQRAEQERRDREETEASLYRYKAQEHGDDRSEDEIDKEEFEKTFPQFTKEFADLVEPTSLEETNVREEVDTSSSLKVTEVQMTQILSLHQRLFKHLVNTDWYKPAGSESVSLSDWTKPVLSGYTAAVKLGDCLSNVLGSHIDGELLGSHLVVSLVQRHNILQAEEETRSPLLETPSVYDIYHDSNVSEVLHCVPVLKAVTARTRELLAEWPDHPTLKQIVEIVSRIESFPITAPVMKFLTGLELLLEKAQHWESNAASFVSMATQLADVSSLIVQWRKLELSCWSQLLEHETHRYQTSASKWWFHLYQLIHAALSPQQSDDEDQPPTTEGQTYTKTTVEDVIKSLKQFIEQASLGDFPVRLDMLLAFHCHLVTMATSDDVATATSEESDDTKATDDKTKASSGVVNMKTDDLTKATGDDLQRLTNALWNLHQFYARFATTVQKQLDSLRAPIEKELKGFVKIARWSDINYWALKQATEKTHRTLHKHIKQFQNVLKQPVQGILVEAADGGDTTTSSSGADNSAWRDKLDHYQGELLQQLKSYTVSKVKMDTTELVPYLSGLISGWAPVLQKPAQLCTRFTRHWRQILASAQYCQLIAGLDQFTGDVIEGIHELQALEIDRSEEKTKQKSDAKHFSMRKRAALSDLFKYLAKLGLSYRKGLALEGPETNAALLVRPLDLCVALSSDPAVQSVWEGCLHYFYRCLSRKAQFAQVIVTPSKELGIGNIERSRGFSGHLFQLLTEQYTAVEKTAAHYKQLQCAIGDLERLDPDKLVQCSQGEAMQWLASCKQLIVQMTEGLNQFLVLLHCCPSQPGEITAHPSPLPASRLHQMALAKAGDEVVMETMQKVQSMLKQVQNSQTMLQSAASLVFTWSDMTKIQTVLSTLVSMVPVMQEVSKLFSDPFSDHPNAFTSVLHFLCDEVTSKSEEFQARLSHLEDHMQTEDADKDMSSSGELTEDMREFSQKTEGLMSAILVAMQKLKKNHAPADDAAVAMEDTEEEEEIIKKGHLVGLVHDKLQLDRNILQDTQVTAMLSDLIQNIVKGDNSSISSTKCQLLQSCVPLLHQYQGVLRHQLISAVATQRAVGKLLAVLLGLFTELATKGFCIPPELSDEMEGEGATEFCDMENAGMGEGEGVKNVSDQIENEDQLDEAKRPEDHKKEEDENQPDVKSEENAIEMSDDFDAKAQDLEDVDKQEDNEEDEEKGDEEEVDKQMGDVDSDDRDKLDEQMWGSDEEEEADSEEKKEEEGPGDGKQSQPELVAKDENQDKEEAEDGNRQDEEQKEEPENENQQPNNLDQLDEENYDDDQVDPYHGEQKEEKQAPDDMDLPDDLKLDDDVSDSEEKGDQQEERMEENTEADDETNLPPEETPEPENAEEKEDEEKGEDGEEKTEKEEDKDSTDRQEEDGTEEQGLNPEDDSTVEQSEETEAENPTEDTTQALEDHGKTSHDCETVEQSDTAQDQAGEATENDQRETDGTGQASSEQAEGHQGQRSTRAADVSSEGKRKKQDRQPGKSDSDRSLGSEEQKYKRLKTTDTRDTPEDQQENSDEKRADEYEHVKDAKSDYDAQTLDVATAEQQQEQGQIQKENLEEEDTEETDLLKDEEKKEEEAEGDLGELPSLQLKKKSKLETDQEGDQDDEGGETGTDQKLEVPGDKVDTTTVARGPESTIHTAMEHLYLDSTTFDLEALRSELESELGSWNQPNLTTNKETERGASDLWHRYELLTSSLAQDLCEQLRLVLEPSQATKLRGDYRTGKRLNMRKVIPYIASQFRKDKIWLRRTKPSKRQYQIMLAIDDSSSMVDNHSKQMAFESLALVSNALTLLEVGQLSICRFGETVHSLHPFTEQFSSQSGAQLLQYLTFEQKKTKIAQLMQYVTSEMLDARQRQPGGRSSGNPETSQLLLIVSDGRGLFTEGMEVVQSAVRRAREAGIFIVFIIIDNPVNKDSILDIKVPVFKPGGQMPEIKSYMDSFPFPFYIILRDINSLPIVLSDALRQWFELVTAVDR